MLMPCRLVVILQNSKSLLLIKHSLFYFILFIISYLGTLCIYSVLRKGNSISTLCIWTHSVYRTHRERVPIKVYVYIVNIYGYFTLETTINARRVMLYTFSLNCMLNDDWLYLKWVYLCVIKPCYWNCDLFIFVIFLKLQRLIYAQLKRYK